MTDYQTKAMIAALKDISTQLKTINRNVNYIGRKLEMIDSTLQKHGIAIMPEAEATKEDDLDIYFSESEIKEWRNKFFDDTNLSDDDAKLVFACITKMINDIATDKEKKGE